MMIGMGIPSNQSRIGISVSLNFVVANAAVVGCAAFKPAKTAIDP